MGYATNGLSFNTLRGANTARLPEFKNGHGAIAHNKEDGSDWSPSQWLQAVIGELGEWAQARIDYEDGRISAAEFATQSAKELADVAIYLDILARRSLDQLVPFIAEGRHQQGNMQEDSPSGALMRLIALLGTYANARKKHERGDSTASQYAAHMQPLLQRILWLSGHVVEAEKDPIPMPHPGDLVVEAHPTGVNLGLAVMDKFNEVSERVGSSVRIAADDWHLVRNVEPNG